MAERAESSAGTKEAHSALTCRLRRRVLLSGFYPQKGESLLPSAVGLGPFWVLVNLLTGLVASYYLFFNYLSYYLYMCPVSAEKVGGKCPVTAETNF